MDLFNADMRKVNLVAVLMFQGVLNSILEEKIAQNLVMNLTKVNNMMSPSLLFSFFLSLSPAFCFNIEPSQALEFPKLSNF